MPVRQISTAISNAIIACLFLIAAFAPHSIAVTQTAWLLGMALWVARFVFNPRPVLHRSPLDYALLGFFVLSGISGIFSYSPIMSIGKMRAASLFTVVYLVSQNVNSLRLVGHSEPIYLLDCGLSPEQREVLKPEATLVSAPGDAPPYLLKTIAPLRHPAEVMVLIDADMIATQPLTELIELASGERVVAFENDRDRFVPEWGELLDLGTSRRQPYVSVGLVLLGVLIVLLFVLFEMFKGGANPAGAQDVKYSDFLNKVEAGEVTNASIHGPEVKFQTSSGTFTTYAPDDPKLIERLTAKGVAIEAGPLDLLICREVKDC